MTPVCSSDAHDRLKRDSDAWALLPALGAPMQLVPDEPPLVLKNCPACHSTLAKEIHHAK